ncbi:MAG TPA: SPFH domain-containing protein [Usitatibacter sp.]|jgi:membrane protease subunit (stomatin/prohibitin family)|nr:SPFH domain-containing protein [Usitatibacter sp.]
MALWDKLIGEFVDIVEWLDDSHDTLAYRFERYQNEIKYGARLVVREGQMAAFVNEGKLADVYKPGTYELTTQNMPILATLRGWKYGFNSPFKAEVYFISTRKFTDLKWGTPGPAMMRDKDFGMVRVTSFGLYSLRAKDAGIIIRDLVGTEGRFTTEDIEENLRGKIGLRIKELLPELGIPVIEMAGKVYEMGTQLRDRLVADFEALGLELTEVQVQNIGLPEEVERAIDKRGAMAAVGDLRSYTQYETASAIRDAANNPGGGAAGAGVGLGAGLAMGAQMMNSMGQAGGASAAASAAAAPPPVPGAALYHVAVGQAQAGPFDMATLKRQASTGELTPLTLVWKPGMAQWVKAGELPELAALFANTPPPLPQ